MGRRGRVVITSAVLAAMFAPVALDRDSFPLSTYPMYSRARSSEVTLATAHGVDRDGATYALSLELIGASDDPLIVAGELRTVIARNRSDERCSEIASRVAVDARALGDDLVAIEVVTERHDVVAQVAGEVSLIERKVHARCPAP